jgi:hydrogenase-1 operon protein HyaF
MKPIELPVIGNPVAAGMDEGAPSYMPMPHDMSTYRAPVLPEPEQTAALTAGLSTLQALQHTLAGYRIGQPPARLNLTELDAANRALVDQVLGEGEVSVRFADGIDARAQESVLAGVWRVQYRDSDGVWRDTIEVADVPSLVRNSPPGSPPPDAVAVEAPPGVINGAPVLTEILDRSANYRSGARAHVINLSLLPMAEADLAYLDAALGRGTVTLLSRGYGNCRITAAGPDHVWWVQYFNSTDVLILNTVEIVDVPQVACAATEDLEDSAERLEELE